MDFQEWLNLYRKKAKTEPFFEPEDRIIQDHKKGIFSYQFDEDTLYVKLVVGDGEYWQAYADALCLRLGLSVILFATVRNPNAWKRRFGYHLVRVSSGWYIMRKFIKGGSVHERSEEKPIRVQ